MTEKNLVIVQFSILISIFIYSQIIEHTGYSLKIGDNSTNSAKNSREPIWPIIVNINCQNTEYLCRIYMFLFIPYIEIRSMTQEQDGQIK